MASIADVYIITDYKSDSMESFVLAETFKYYYLLVSFILNQHSLWAIY